MTTETCDSTPPSADEQHTYIVRSLVWWQLLFLMGVVTGLGLFDSLPFLKG